MGQVDRATAGIDSAFPGSLHHPAGANQPLPTSTVWNKRTTHSKFLFFLIIRSDL
jgi:hypothetical protein